MPENVTSYYTNRRIIRAQMKKCCFPTDAEMSEAVGPRLERFSLIDDNFDIPEDAS